MFVIQRPQLCHGYQELAHLCLTKVQDVRPILSKQWGHVLHCRYEEPCHV